jgi:hypothetical protein
MMRVFGFRSVLGSRQEFVVCLPISERLCLRMRVCLVEEKGLFFMRHDRAFCDKGLGAD